MKRIIVRQDVHADLARYVRHIAQDNPKSGEDFASAAQLTFERIAQFPALGKLRRWRQSELAGVRFRVMPRPFSAWLVFYRELSAAVEILRVLHGVLDLEARFTEPPE